MITSDNIYEYYNGNQLGVNQDVFIELGLLTYHQFQHWCSKERAKLNRLRTAGRGRTGLIAWSSIPDEYLEKIKKAFGDPYRKNDVKSFVDKLTNDDEAAVFYMKAGLSQEKEYQHYIEAQILNLYGELLQEIEVKSARNTNFKKTQAKRELAKVITDLKTLKREDGKARYPHKLPSNGRSLERRYNEYKDLGYDRLIHGGTGNTNTQKIKGALADWLLAKYCLPNKPTTTDLHLEYDSYRKSQKWPSLHEDAIYKWLQKPEQKKVWVLARHGKDEYVRLFGHKTSRDKSDYFPFAYLAIDGSKLDWIHYKENASNKMGADIKINIVVDVYSEKIVGYDFGLTEDHQSHFRAFKMAMQETGCKPALLTYDNQSGHKMQAVQDLYSQLVTSNGGQHYPHRAYEHGSPVEQIFSRFQQQILNKFWFSDKQAITSRTADSRPNMEFVKRNKEKLKTIEELKAVFDYCVAKWNKADQPKLKVSRNEAATHKQTYALDKLTMLDMMQLFWVTTKDTNTYQRDGIKPTVGKERYHYEVYDANGHVDLDFRDKYTGCKFFVQYDPDELDNYVRLYLKLPNGDSKYITDAQPVKQIKSIPATMDDQDRGRVHKMTGTRDKDLERVEAQLEALRQRTNITEETLIEDQELELKYRGRQPKQSRALAETGAGSWLNKL
ncbi:hypothetical protein QO206_03195 [Leeuwenhoekiella aequorea]|uniref:hypothetical protein n=1 Tax=Leeuwenhoekiella aequorea TaxID=283736 RepID=UPI00352CB57F|tara:strand:+ start:1743 stop:3746 length:2004 start_codon:yes stop_codon:yes gene_type:complete